MSNSTGTVSLNLTVVGPYFFMTLPTPQTRYSRKHREWTASDDACRVAAVGATKKEAIARFHNAYLTKLLTPPNWRWAKP